MTSFTESEIEIFSLSELKRLGFSCIPGPSIAPNVKRAVREQPLQGFMVAETAAPYGGSACAPACAAGVVGRMHADKAGKTQKL